MKYSYKVLYHKSQGSAEVKSPVVPHRKWTVCLTWSHSHLTPPTAMPPRAEYTHDQNHPLNHTVSGHSSPNIPLLSFSTPLAQILSPRTTGSDRPGTLPSHPTPRPPSVKCQPPAPAADGLSRLSQTDEALSPRVLRASSPRLLHRSFPIPSPLQRPAPGLRLGSPTLALSRLFPLSPGARKKSQRPANSGGVRSPQTDRDGGGFPLQSDTARVRAVGSF